ncbi:TolB family protein, partial [candidate division KSB1 bacterium]
MTKKSTIILNLILLVFPFCFCSGQNEGEFAEYKYFGIDPPGIKPELFAPSIISVEDVQHCFPAFAPNGLEVYWMQFNIELRNSVLMFMEYKDNSWSKPDTALFSVGYRDTAPVFSADGKRLFFVSSRPGGKGKGDIWYIDKNDAGWSEPVNPGAPINTEKRESQPTFTNDGTMYFVRWTEGYEYGWAIYRSKLINGRYT